MSGKDGGWRLPDPVDPEQTLAVCICIPDEDNHIAAFWGALQELGYWFNWERDEAHTGLAASILWNSIVQTAHEKFNEGVMCGSCEEFTACLEPLMTAVAALQAAVDIIQANQYGGTGNEPHELTPEEMNANLAEDSNPGCDKDILWSQALAVVRTTNTVLIDFLENFEASTNVIEVIQSFAQAPILNELGSASIANLITSTQAAVAENYVDAYTLEYEQQLACELFCASRPDCTITVDRMWQIVLERAQANIEGVTGDWLTLAQFLNELAFLNINSVNVADFAFLMAWGTLKFSNWMNPFIPGTRAIQVAILLAADEPSNDWEILCECLAEECCYDWVLVDHATIPVGLNIYTNGVWIDNLGVLAEEISTGVWAAGFSLDIPNTRITSMEVEIKNLDGATVSGDNYYIYEAGWETPPADTEGTAVALPHTGDFSGEYPGSTGEVNFVRYLVVLNNPEAFYISRVNICYECVDPVTPVINMDDWLTGSSDYGGVVENLGGGLWKVTTTNEHSSDWQLNVTEAAGRAFIISEISYNGITPQCNWYHYEAGDVHLFDGCDNDPAYTGAALFSFGKTFTTNTEMYFRMTEA